MSKGYSSKENLAYNFELFEPMTKVVAKPKEIVVAKPKPHLLNVKSVAAFLIFIVTISFILTGYAKVSELTAKSAALQKQLTTLESEEKRLNLETEKKTNLKTIDDIAKNQLNMTKVQSYQVEYVGLNKTDKAEILKSSPISNAISAISQGISSIKEYLK